MKTERTGRALRIPNSASEKGKGNSFPKFILGWTTGALWRLNVFAEHAVGAGVTDVPRELLRDEPDRNSFYQG